MVVEWEKAINVNILCLKFMGVWPRLPHDSALYSAYSGVIMALMGLFFLFEGIQLNYITSLNETVELLLFMSAVLLCYLKMWIFIRSSARIRTLLGLLKSPRFQPKGMKLEKLVEDDLTVWKKFYKFLLSGAYCAGSGCTLVPILTGAYKVSLLAAPIFCPLDCSQTLDYVLMYIYTSLCLAILIIATNNMDMFFAALMVFLGAQCDILCQNLQNPKLGNFGQKILFCVRHHQEILQFVKEFRRFCNLSLLFQFLLCMLSVSMSLFQMAVSKRDSFVFYSFFIIASVLIAQIFSYCFFGNIVLSKSEKISYSAFKSSWIQQPNCLKKVLLIFLMKAQNPIIISAFKLFDLTFENFVKIMKSAWSYFMILQQLNLES